VDFEVCQVFILHTEKCPESEGGDTVNNSKHWCSNNGALVLNIAKAEEQEEIEGNTENHGQVNSKLWLQIVSTPLIPPMIHSYR
jgi:hypothetical protein